MRNKTTGTLAPDTGRSQVDGGHGTQKRGATAVRGKLPCRADLFNNCQCQSRPEEKAKPLDAGRFHAKEGHKDILSNTDRGPDAPDAPDRARHVQRRGEKE